MIDARTRTAAIFGCRGTQLSRDEAAFIADCQPAGFILFARNVDTPDQLRRLTADLCAAAGRDLPIFTDQEGGRVQRLRAPHWREWAPPLDFAAAAAAGPQGARAAERAMELRARLIARELRAVGITGNCVPSADIAWPGTHPFLYNRCYGEDPATVAHLARATARGVMAEGLWPVMKHLPGHGRAEADSHHDLPRIDVPLDALERTDFAPFRALADLPLAMTAHVVLVALDPARPATLSPPVIALIRDRIGFRGLLMTDDLNMGALGGSLADRAAAALAAGCDLALHCNGDLAEMVAVAAAAGAPSAASLARGARLTPPRPTGEPIDSGALEAELQALMAAKDLRDGRG